MLQRLEYCIQERGCKNQRKVHPHRSARLCRREEQEGMHNVLRIQNIIKEEHAHPERKHAAEQINVSQPQKRLEMPQLPFLCPHNIAHAPRQHR